MVDERPSPTTRGKWFLTRVLFNWEGVGRTKV
jgi:hypothetical protein